eukprot:1555488-Pleurochrysis_carterae.AAC.2
MRPWLLKLEKCKLNESKLCQRTGASDGGAIRSDAAAIASRHSASQGDKPACVCPDAAAPAAVVEAAGTLP